MHSNFNMAILNRKLKYKIPNLKLCLVEEGKQTKKTIQIKCPEDVSTILEPLKYASEEYFVSLHLNVKHEVIGLHEVSHGTLSTSLVHPREVFKAALIANSYAIIVCHNHPSGRVLHPSAEDINTTEQLIQSSKFLGIALLDHVILGRNCSAYSIREFYPSLWD